MMLFIFIFVFDFSFLLNSFFFLLSSSLVLLVFASLALSETSFATANNLVYLLADRLFLQVLLSNFQSRIWQKFWLKFGLYFNVNLFIFIEIKPEFEPEFLSDSALEVGQQNLQKQTIGQKINKVVSSCKGSLW